MGVKGLLDTCSRCGDTVFRKMIGTDYEEAPGWVCAKVYTRENCTGWPRNMLIDICPTCAEKLLALNDEFLRSGKEDVLDAAD